MLSLLTTLALLAPFAPQSQDRPPEPSHAAQAETRPAAVDTARFLTSRTAGIDLPLPDEDDAFFFMVYGDRTGGPDEGVEILREAVGETNLLGPDLVMTVGDLIQGYNRPQPWMKEMREYRGIMGELDMPWFPVAGNHDIYFRGPEGQERPAEEHEGRYEMHFGPLWYAFRHKSAWFIVLYTDEANPDYDPANGGSRRNFNDPDCQRMSPEQLAWLDQTLEVTKGAEHVFVFCHHPRWVGGNYGKDWDKVHARLVKAGNVKGVFGGHIHRMRYDPKDGIEYFALATIGGHQNGSVPEAGYLQCFDLVTVRKDRIERATLPVGVTMDPREITGEVSQETPRLLRVLPHWSEPLRFAEDGAVAQDLRFTITNPVSRPVEFEARFVSSDPRWTFVPDHVHGKIGPEGSLRSEVRITRAANAIDGGIAAPEIELAFDYLTDTARFAIPRRTRVFPVDMDTLPLPTVPADERVLKLSGGAHVRVDSDAASIEDGPFTLEGWIRADRFQGRQGVIAKTESSEYGIFASNGELAYSVHLNGKYVTPTLEGRTLEKGRWYHVAGVYDGAEVRLYLDGELVAREAGSGTRTRNTLPLIVGGDVRNNGAATATFQGAIDEVRLSTGARYTGERFTPMRRLEDDAATRLLLHMDASFGPYLRGGRTAGATLEAGARTGG